MREYLLVLLVTAATTYLLSGLARRLALRTGAVAKVRDRDVHAVPIPYFGGVAMLLGVVAAYVLSTHLPFLGRNLLIQHDFRAILLAAAVISIVGVLDDLYELNAIAKLAGQVLAAGLVVTQGVKMLWIPLPNSIISLDDSVSIAITVFFIVLCTNAVNYVDGLDGLAAGVVAIGALAFFTYSYALVYDTALPRAQTASLLSIAIAGICIGFLPHNYFPARMFMGDSGAMLLGLMLATTTISLTGQIDSSQLQGEGSGLMAAYLPLILPLAILALPFLDFVLAFVRRTYAGTWFWVADKQHLHHRLLDRGHSHRRAVVLMYIWTALISFGVIGIGLAPRWETIAIVIGLMGVVTYFTLGAPAGKPGATPEVRQAEREAEARIQETPPAG